MEEEDAHLCLFVENIVDNILSFIVLQPSSTDAAKDVKSIRLVCKLWKESVTRLYRQTRAVTVLGGVDIAASLERMRKFFDIMRASPMIPVQNYIIDGTFVMQDRRIMRDFIRICGPETVSLKLHIGDSIVDTFGLGIPPHVVSFPKLKILQLTIFHHPGPKDSVAYPYRTHRFVQFIGDLLEGAKMLMDLKLHFIIIKFEGMQKQQVTHVDGLPILVGLFDEHVLTRIPRKVKSLELVMPLSELALGNVARIGLKLDSVCLPLNPDFGNGILLRFLESQASSLKELLCLKSDMEPKFTYFKFPQLKELTSLSLAEINVEGFCFSKIFPKLRILNVQRIQSESFLLGLLSFADRPVSSVKVLLLPYSFPIAPIMWRLSECFNNLVELHISPTPEIEMILREVFTNFCNLENLYVTFNMDLNVDSVFSGVPEEDCKRIGMLGNFDNEELEQWQCNPSILNLIKLKKLVLTKEVAQDRVVVLTNFSANFLFLQMADLKVLKLPTSQISRRFKKLLRDKLTLTFDDNDE